MSLDQRKIAVRSSGPSGFETFDYLGGPKPVTRHEALAAHEVSLPATRVFDSVRLGWKHAIVAGYRYDASTGDFTTMPTEHLLVAHVTGGDYLIEQKRAGEWSSSVFRPGSLSVILPGQACALRWSSLLANPLEITHVLLEVALFDGLGLVSRLDGREVRDPYVREATTVLGNAAKTGGPAAHAEAVAIALAHRLSTLAAESTGLHSKSSRGLDTRTLQRVVKYMDDRIADDLRLSDLAEQAHFSKHYFLRCFKASTGLTPKAYLTDLRMRRAAEMLQEDDKTVSAIALACGYRSLSQFTSTFARAHHLTPGEYRSRALSTALPTVSART